VLAGTLDSLGQRRWTAVESVLERLVTGGDACQDAERARLLNDLAPRIRDALLVGVDLSGALRARMGLLLERAGDALSSSPLVPYLLRKREALQARLGTANLDVGAFTECELDGQPVVIVENRHYRRRHTLAYVARAGRWHLVADLPGRIDAVTLSGSRAISILTRTFQDERLTSVLTVDAPSRATVTTRPAVRTARERGPGQDLRVTCIPEPPRSGIAAVQSSTRLDLPRPAREWTILVWAGGDNTLSRSIQRDVQRIIAQGAGRDLNIVIMEDLLEFGGQDFHVRVVDDTPGQYTDVNPEGIPDLIRTSPTRWEIDSADWHNLAAMGKWVTKNFPARKYGWVVGSHGSGWGGIVQDLTDHGYKSLMENYDIAGAFETILQANGGKRWEVVLHDACLMNLFDAHYHLKKYVRNVIASQGETDGHFPYEAVLTALKAHPGMDGHGLGKAVVGLYDRSSSYASIDLEAMDRHLVPAYDDLMQQLKHHVKNGGVAIEAARARAQSSSASHPLLQAMKDFDDFALDLARHAGESGIAAAAGRVVRGIQAAAVATHPSPAFPGQTGMNVEFFHDRIHDSRWKPGRYHHGYETQGGPFFWAWRNGVEVANEPPVIQVEAVCDGAAVHDGFTLAGTATDKDGIAAIEYRWDEGRFQSLGAAQGPFSFHIPARGLTPGRHVLWCRARDAYKQEITANRRDDGTVEMYTQDVGYDYSESMAIQVDVE
jgi:hypothetical protein